MIFLGSIYCCSAPKGKHLAAEPILEPKVDTTIFVEVSDSLRFNVDHFIEMRLYIINLDDSLRAIRLNLVNISGGDIFMDTLNLDQLTYNQNHTFYFGPDIDCHVPMYFFLLPQNRQVTMEHLLVDNTIDTVNIILCGTRDITRLKKEVRGHLDTIPSGNLFDYTLSYDCQYRPERELFSIEILKIPVRNMKGLASIRVKGV